AAEGPQGKTQQGSGRDPRVAGRQRAPADARRNAAPDDARAVRRVHQERSRAAGKSRQGFRCESGLMQASPKKTVDKRIEIALRAWAPRFVASGVPLADFEEVTGGL